MKFLKKSSEDEMIAVFLQTEINSLRFGNNLKKILQKFKVKKSIIKKPDINNILENQLRKTIIADYRGYGKNKELFENFPKNIEWVWISLSKKELKKIKYINYDYWIELSRGSRLAEDAVKNIRNGIEIFNKSNERFLNAAKSLIGGNKFPPMILVSKDKNSFIIVLEGHLRLTAYMLELKKTPSQIKAIIGYSKDFIT